MRIYIRWYLVFFIILITTGLGVMLFNATVDPFGTFGDRLFDMQNYNMKNNIRIAKISYLDKNYKKFDSYILGGSKSGSFLPEMVDRYYKDASFYNLNMIGGRFYDYEKTLHYIYKHYKVKNIVFQISQLEANKPGTSTGAEGMLHGKLLSDFPLVFYLKMVIQHPSYSLDKIEEYIKGNNGKDKYFFYNIKNGSYNFLKNEERIKNNPDEYFYKSNYFQNIPAVKGTVFEYNLIILKRIVSFCRENNINLLVVAAPTYTKELASYPLDKLGKYMKEISKITDYWNFSGYNSVNTEIKNFYNSTHFRTKVTKMMLARMFKDSSVKVPEDFGVYVTPENADKVIDKAMKPVDIKR